jgi:hypothetical protein
VIVRVRPRLIKPLDLSTRAAWTAPPRDHPDAVGLLDPRGAGCEIGLAKIGQPKELEIPELGIKFENLPPTATAPSIGERPEGYEAWLDIGNALVDIYRVDDPVEPGGSLADPAFRATLLTRLDTLRKPTSAGCSPTWEVTRLGHSSKRARSTALQLVPFESGSGSIRLYCAEPGSMTSQSLIVVHRSGFPAARMRQ